MVKKVWILVNYNLYESKRYFTEKLSQSLESQGVKVTVFDVKEANLSKEVIGAIKKDAPDLTLSYNSFLPLEKGKYLWDLLKIPHLSLLLDPALYSVSLSQSPYSLLSCVDRSDVQAMNNYNFDKIFFWPHAADGNITYDVEADRPLDVVFLGSCYDYENLRKGWQERLPDGVSHMLDRAIDRVLTDNTIPLTEALVASWNDAKIDPKGIDFPVLFYYLDYYVRGYDRMQLIRGIKNANVHIYGELSADNTIETNGWDHYLGEQKNVTLYPSVPFSEGLEILKKSKICLNSMPFFRDGSHERVFNGLLCGALPITSESMFLRESFKESESLCYYRSQEWSRVDETVSRYLTDESARQAVVKKGQSLVKEHHTFDVRARELLETVPQWLPTKK